MAWHTTEPQIEHVEKTEAEINGVINRVEAVIDANTQEILETPEREGHLGVSLVDYLNIPLVVEELRSKDDRGFIYEVSVYCPAGPQNVSALRRFKEELERAIGEKR